MANYLPRLLNPTPMQSQSGAMPVMPQPQMQAPQMAQKPNGMNFLRDLLAGSLMAYGGGGMGPLIAQQEQKRRQQEELTQKTEAEQRRNMTADYFEAKDPELANAIRTGVIDGQTAFSVYQKRKGQDMEPEQFGLSPIYGTDPKTGKTVIGVMGNRGTFKPIDTGGIELSNGIEKVDLGTAYQLIDKRTGQVMGTIPKENYQAAFETGAGSEAGKAYGGDVGLLSSVESKMPGLEKVVADLEVLADTATYTTIGQMGDTARREAGLPATEAAVARAKYIAMVDNQVLPMLRDTFGAAFTVKEGETLRATLGDPNKSPAEKKAVLRAFIDQKKRDVAALRARTGGVGAAPAPAGGAVTIDGFTIEPVE